MSDNWNGRLEAQAVQLPRKNKEEKHCHIDKFQQLDKEFIIKDN